jgi:predicted esterase
MTSREALALALLSLLALGASGAACSAPTAPTVEDAPPSSAAETASAAASPPTPVASPSSSAPAPAPAPERPALDGPRYVELPVAGHETAIVAVPVGAKDPQRIVLATHGNYDTPAWQCSTWREIVGPESFVLCPRGIPRPDSPSRDDIRFTYASNAALEKEIEAALDALRARYGAHLAEVPVLYTGFSLGAIMGVAIAARAKHPGRYEAMVLVEGGHDRWKPETAAAFAKAGGKRVLFACGQASCLLEAKRAAQHLERAGVATKVVGVKDEGHSYGGRVAEHVKGAWSFVDATSAARVEP